MTTKNIASISLITAASFWGFNPYMKTVMLNYATPMTIIFLSYLVSAFLAFVILLISKQFRIPSAKNLLLLFITGACLVGINSTFITLGLQYTSVTDTALFKASSPIFIAFFSLIFLKEKLCFIQWLGIFIVLLGTLYTLIDGKISTLTHFNFNKGDIFLIIAQIGWAGYALFSSRLLKEIKVMELIFWCQLFGVLVVLSYSLFGFQISMPKLTKDFVDSLLYTSIFSFLLGMYLWNIGIKHIGASISGIFVNLSTIIAIASGVLLLHEPFGINELFGAVTVLLGILILVQYQNIEKMFNFIRRKERNA